MVYTYLYRTLWFNVLTYHIRPNTKGKGSLQMLILYQIMQSLQCMFKTVGNNLKAKMILQSLKYLLNHFSMLIISYICANFMSGHLYIL